MTAQSREDVTAVIEPLMVVAAFLGEGSQRMPVPGRADWRQEF